MMRAEGCDQDTRSDEPAMGSRQQPVAMIVAAVMLSGTLVAQELPGKAFAVSPPSAEDRAFWSFRPLEIGQPPVVGNADWCRNGVDRFILSRLEQRGLAANDRADRRTLLRRACFSLLGLPPRPGELVAFQNEHSPAAWSDLVDRLLASPRYGERWARHWMDVARFAESGGFEHDDDRPNAYHYRDFLVAAFNGDLPFDRFVRWQLAGDELAPEDPLALMATGFLGAGVFPSQLTEAEFESARYDELDDMVTTTGVAFLGLSIGCARCHDHKYDPIPSRDYYRLVSAFTTAIRGEIATKADWHHADHKVLVTSEGLPKLKHHADGRGFPHFYKQTFFLSRGDVRRKQGEADVGFLQVLISPQAAESRWRRAAPPGWTRTSFRRASLAGWLTDVEQGAGRLVARVIVNRLWHHHFGRGLVETTNDFGRQGER
ncbi:MAG: DUF1549 domain-containing protein, partial [Planctomycetaceae bacterium]|nr:DUF1549 domain-containing protein [Planctomycetaceae bacterium]